MLKNSLRFIAQHMLLVVWLLCIPTSTSIPAPTPQEMDELKSLMKEGKPLFFNRMRHDGAGATAANLLYAASYADHRGWTYAGALAYWVKGKFYNHKHMVDVPSMVEFVFGRKLIYQNAHVTQLAVDSIWAPEVVGVERSLQNMTGPPWPAQVIVLDSYVMHKIEKVLPAQELSIDGGVTKKNVSNLGHIITPEFLKKIRAANPRRLEGVDYKFYPGAHPTVAIHIRRGDIGPSDKLRYTPNSYYIDIARRIRAVYPEADIHAFTSLEGGHQGQEFAEFQQVSIPVHFEDVHAQLSWSHFMKADIFIMAKSGFSHVPALLSEHCVVYEPFHMGKLPHWATVSELSVDYIRSCAN